MSATDGVSAECAERCESDDNCRRRPRRMHESMTIKTTTNDTKAQNSPRSRCCTHRTELLPIFLIPLCRSITRRDASLSESGLLDVADVRDRESVFP